MSQGREAIRLLADEGIRVGLVKIKTLRPWPEEEIKEATKHAKHIIVPEFNVIGWMAKEIKATIPRSERVSGRSAGVRRHDHATGNYRGRNKACARHTLDDPRRSRLTGNEST